jgi:DNA-binding CsgD family transcriptional regulator
VAERVARLSEGQLEVLRLVDQHHNSKEIAARLGISPHTVDQRVRGAIRTLGVARRSEAARLVAEASSANLYQRLIHQAPHIDADRQPFETDGAVSFQIRHADRAKGGEGFGVETEQSPDHHRPPLFPPWSTQNNPRNAMSVGQRLLWILTIAMGSAFSAGMYLAGLESLARLAHR